jgi:hypothetical protein
MIKEPEKTEVGLQTEIRRAFRVLEAYYQMEPSIQRIQDIVEKNPDLFGTKWGNDLLASAADLLERLVEGHILIEKLAAPSEEE